MNIQKVIEQLGYSAKEAKVYLAALALGECHISDIAAKAKIPRTSAQVIVDKLHEDGLMNFYVQRRYKYWVAENPERLLLELTKREEAIREAIPELTALRRAGRNNGRKKIDTEQSLGLFRVMADASSQPVLIANENVEIEYVNAAWEEQFGYSLNEVRGENPRIFRSGKTPQAVYDRMWKTLRSGKMFQSDDIIDKKKNGALFNLLTTIFVVTHNDRRYYFQILDDITESKRVERLQKDFMRTVSQTRAAR